jgi:hypothetical protein
LIEKQLLDAHRLIGDRWTGGTAQCIFRATSDAPIESMAAEALHRELAEHNQVADLLGLKR